MPPLKPVGEGNFTRKTPDLQDILYEEGNRGKKNLPSLPDEIEGTRALGCCLLMRCMECLSNLSTPVVPPCLPRPACLTELREITGSDHFFTVIVLRGNRPPVPTYLCPTGSLKARSQMANDFLRPAAHEGVLRGLTIPNFHSASDRCWEPHLVLCSLNAGQLVINLLLKDSSRQTKSQPTFPPDPRVREG